MSDIVERLLTTRIVKTCDGGEHVLINPDGPEAAQEIARLRAENERLTELLDELQAATGNYRYTHDLRGDGHSETGRAWDMMRRCEDRARKALEDSHD